MREHKYRAWNKRLGKMQQVLEIVLDPEFGGVLVWGKASVDFSTGEHEAAQDFWPWDDIELRQYIGRKDRNGREIYEGDIILRSHNNDPHSIAWDADGYWMQHPSGGGQSGIEEDCEIVGNLYETPDLARSTS